MLGSYPIAPSLGHPPRAGEAQEFAPHVPGRGRDRRLRLRSAPPRRPSRRHHPQQARRRPQERDDEPRHAASNCRSAPGRHPARRAVDRPAHQDRGRRPPDRPLRPPRRGATAGRRGVHPDALLLRRDRGGPARPQVPHAGRSCCPTATWPTAPSLGASPTSPTCPTSRCRSPTKPNHVDDDGTASSGRTSATPRPGPPVGHPGHAGLMHRVGGLEKDDGTGNIDYDAREPQHDGRICAPAKVAGIANDIPPATLEGDEDADLLVARLGEHLGGHRRSGAAEPRARAQGGLDPPGPPQPAPGQPGRHRPPLPEDPDARAQPRPAVEGRAGRVPGRRRSSLTKVQGLPFTATEIEAAIEEMIGAA